MQQDLQQSSAASGRRVDGPVQHRRQRDGGYLLLAILLMMALMIIAATIVAPRVVQQIKRDREEEMIHRGTEYARAIKKYYKKFGSYPSTLEQLDTTNQIRFLRKRYKDPLTKDGKWKLLNYGDIATLLNAAAPGTPAAALAVAERIIARRRPDRGRVCLGQAYSQARSSSNSSQGTPSRTDFRRRLRRETRIPTSFIPRTQITRALACRQAQANSGQSESGSQQSSSLFGQSGAAGGNQPRFDEFQRAIHRLRKTRPAVLRPLAAEQSSGVASLSKDPTIRIYNKKKTYNEWQFIYNPMMDVQNVLLRGPYQPMTIGGAQIGTPASQMNGQQQGAFGQQQNGFGQQQNGFGQQQNGFGQQQKDLGNSQHAPTARWRQLPAAAESQQ